MISNKNEINLNTVFEFQSSLCHSIINLFNGKQKTQQIQTT